VAFPMEVRRRNVLRISQQACDECMTLEAFYEAHQLGFVLFFERALVSAHRYKTAIVKGFHEACAELRWSRVTCGVVDMVEDRGYAVRYIDPKTAPAHIVVKDGEPVPALKRHVDPLLKKPGDKGTILWHVRSLLAPDEPPGALDIAALASSREAVSQLLQNHKVVIAGAVGAGRGAADAFCAAAQRLVLGGGVAGEVQLGAGVANADSLTPPKRGVRRWRRARRRRRVAFVAVSGAKAKAALGLEDGAVLAFVGGQKQPTAEEPRLLGRSEAEAMEALQAAALPAIQAAAAAAADAAGAVSGAGSQPAKGKGARASGRPEGSEL